MKNNNQINVPEARDAMDQFKKQAATDFDVNLHINDIIRQIIER